MHVAERRHPRHWRLDQDMSDFDQREGSSGGHGAGQ